METPNLPAGTCTPSRAIRGARDPRRCGGIRKQEPAVAIFFVSPDGKAPVALLTAERPQGAVCTLANVDRVEGQQQTSVGAPVTEELQSSILQRPKALSGSTGDSRRSAAGSRALLPT